jgi:hypothetical protein
VKSFTAAFKLRVGHIAGNVTWNDRITRRWWTGNKFGSKQSWPSPGTILELPWRSWGNLLKTQLGINKIRTHHLSNWVHYNISLSKIPSLESNGHSPSQITSRSSWNPKVHLNFRRRVPASPLIPYSIWFVKRVFTKRTPFEERPPSVLDEDYCYLQHGVCDVGSGVRLSPLGAAATTGLLYQPQMIDDGDYGAIVGIKIGRGNRRTRR